MDNRATDLINALAPQAIAELKNYFATADDGAGKRADVALKLLGRINGNDSNRLKALALQFQVARHMGLKGEPLRPLLAELNPQFARGAAAQESAGALASPLEQQVAAKSPGAPSSVTA
jgi:hypothetical protein